MGSFSGVIILADIWKIIFESYKSISDKMDLAETFQIFTFLAEAKLEELKIQKERFEESYE